MQSSRTGRRWGSVRLSVCPRVRLNFSRTSICLRDLPLCVLGATLWLPGDLGDTAALPQGAAERRWPGLAVLNALKSCSVI